MKSFRILAGFMVVFLIVFLSLSTAADAKDDGDSGHHKKWKRLPKHARVLQKQIKANTAAIENIELTPGPQGDKGDTGAAGPTGATGATGPKGSSIQGPKGDPGQSGIGDMNTVCDGTTTGMIRYNTDDSAFEGCDGTAWVSLTLSNNPPPVLYSVGDTGPAGGIVFYITPGSGGQHGLEAATTDQDGGSGVPWGCHNVSITGADGKAVGTGAQNTADILAGCSEAGTAAKIVDAYTLGGYNDWFLPSKDELNLLYQHWSIVGGFAAISYWSSTEYDQIRAFSQHFRDGVQPIANKGFSLYAVRPIRAF